MHVFGILFLSLLHLCPTHSSPVEPRNLSLPIPPGNDDFRVEVRLSTESTLPSRSAYFTALQALHELVWRDDIDGTQPSRQWQAYPTVVIFIQGPGSHGEGRRTVFNMRYLIRTLAFAVDFYSRRGVVNPAVFTPVVRGVLSGDIWFKHPNDAVGSIDTVKDGMEIVPTLSSGSNKQIVARSRVSARRPATRQVAGLMSAREDSEVASSVMIPTDYPEGSSIPVSAAADIAIETTGIPIRDGLFYAVLALTYEFISPHGRRNNAQDIDARPQGEAFGISIQPRSTQAGRAMTYSDVIRALAGFLNKITRGSVYSTMKATVSVGQGDSRTVIGVVEVAKAVPEVGASLTA